MQKNDVRSLTEGAMFGALFAVVLVLIRFFLSSVDSLIYYILPLPLLIYTLKSKKSFAVILFFVMLALSFLIVDPYRALLLILPNLVIGLGYGLLRQKIKNNFLDYLVLFLLCVIANFLSIWAYQLIFGLSYFDTSLNDFAFLKNLFVVDDVFLARLIAITIPIVFVIDALVKTVLLNIILILINNKLHLFPYEKGVKLYFRFYLPLSFLLLLIPTVLLTVLNFKNGSHTLILIILYSLVGILSLYFLFQYVYVVSFYFNGTNRHWLGVFLSIIGFLLFPIGILLGGCFNFIFKRKAGA